MFVFKNEEKLNGNTVINVSSIYRSKDGNTYCEGCMTEPYYDHSNGRIWYRRSSSLKGKSNRVYQFVNNRFKRVKGNRKIPDWPHRIIISKLQKF
jgi:hypothetical protein